MAEDVRTLLRQERAALADVLADTITHHLDVRVPLGKERQAPGEATGIALTRYTRMGFPLSLAFGRNPKATAKQLRLVASDIGWSHRDGPVVTASSSARGASPHRSGRAAN